MTVRIAHALALAALSLGGCASAPPPRAFSGAPAPPREGERFVIAGDPQRTSWLEFWREQNDPERARVIADIAALRPAFVAFTGDLVFDGDSASQWADFDALTDPLRAARIPVYAAFGNHEYWSGRAGEARFFARFPHLEKRHYYTILGGPVRLVVLDSNMGEMSSREWQSQLAWYRDTLAALDADEAVRGVLVLLHHPPFTNSTVTGDEPHVQRDIVPPFLHAQKTLALHSGHVHSYERFARGGKMFVVSGGAGGPRARLAVDTDRRHADDLFHGGALRPFNFVVYTLTATGLAAQVRGLRKGTSTFVAIDRYELSFPAATR